jgi:hypothetical protein
VSPGGQNLVAALCVVVLCVVATSVAFREGSRVWACVGVSAFFSFSLLAAWLLWRLP